MATRYLLIISSIVLCLSPFSNVFGEKTTLHFDEVEELGIKRSPLVEMTKQKFQQTKAEQQHELQWQNPELGFERATAEDEAEQVISLGKEFDMPWIYLKRRGLLKDQLNAAELQMETEIRFILGDLKSGYVELQLMNRQVSELDSLVTTLQKLFDSTREQWEAGTLSGVERQMIHFTLIDIMSELNDLKKDYRLQKSSWLNDMGLTYLEDPVFATPFYYEDFDLQSSASYTAELDGYSGFLGKKAEVDADKKMLGIEKSALFPGFSVEAGYRTVDPDLTGYTVGFSIPLPLLNQNRSKIQQQKVQLKSREIELDYYRYSLKSEIEQLVLSIEDQMNLLNQNSSCMLTMDSYLEGIIQAYKEGWMSLPEMLEGIELFVKGQTSLNKLIAGYYSDLFRLEAITGETIVTSPDRKGDN